MENPQAPATYLVFAGYIDQIAVQRLFEATTHAIRAGSPSVHLLLQSVGGNIQDGVCLYNYFKTLPVPISIYNAGSVCSAAVTAYLGAPDRVTSALGTFMIHRTHATLQGANADMVQARAQSLVIDEDRMDRILKAHVRLPDDKLEVHRYADVWLTANEAVDTGLATRLGDFAPPLGIPVFNVLA
ncbi:ATP-dependent Clp protease proteolytic subunit [Microvirga sp. HBU67558]|uniref:ATP-dependent Clp protease proteolytic subunit n=1 Tax=Microvirga sp. HBU67558 TaxID=2824562 RepID=UPI001B374825|nr:ATP-dependent Clp protease proteolytic subunit [Microvirga sp. HBU67558]MBQ0818890.1 ATP-dependent Clp protease proteolytic subunit [Microvirga sp. HBU67558]